ncbi:cytochrome c oxidase subunit 6a, mitochondrial-like isoform X2 [Lycium ferocissimum]|uniref:cytochrome c oxidase subunit 6a, mitochondrial-like isoform X2 n=1 Tax=Lycium ferocissimum TaxID=112874 RepID=UPI0028151811|nr:cytochrome c oxidase subunit 6a, mitochondrial-like isoform X2 [Lycium ferocissimum]
MASALIKSNIIRSALRGGASGGTPAPALKRTFASSTSHHDEAREAAKWEKITYIGIVTCAILTIFNLAKGHPHHEEPPPYPYLHIRNKEFPWGPDGLFEKKHH